jgi:BirA family biotin operon repressor/biotin-[acetyl-CoA-carboxylase] ligase
LSRPDAELPFDLPRIQANALGRNVEYHPVIDSTNDEAKRRVAAATCPLPLLVLASRQTAGRGRGRNRWWSDEGCLMFSLALAAEAFPDDRQHAALASLAVAIAVVDAVGPRLTGQPLGIHWPNDVVVGPRKLAGILIEVAAGRRHVIGIGLNVNNQFEGAPDDVRARAVSLSQLGSPASSPTAVLVDLLVALERRLAELVHSPATISNRASELCLQRGQELTIQQGQTRTAGRCLGIAPDGGLILETPTGQRRLASGITCRDD